METKEESTQPAFEEEWGVQVGRELFVLNERQIKLLKQANISNQRGIIWFDKFAISIPHIQTIWRISRRPKHKLPAGERDAQMEVEMTREQKEKARAKIQEMKKEFMTRLRGVKK